MQSSARSHTGLVRQNNEDSWHIDPAGRFAVVADGMGGLQAGEVASAVAVQTVVDLAEDREIDREFVSDALAAAHVAVRSKALEISLVGHMGTTLLIWAAGPSGVIVGHVGDSRAYAVVDGEVAPLTKDHSVAQRLVDLGLVEGNDLSNAPNRHVLTQALGLPGEFEPEIVEHRQSAQRYLLCSDGLSDYVSEAKLRLAIAPEDLEVAADALQQAALDAGGHDNITLVLIDP